MSTMRKGMGTMTDQLRTLAEAEAEKRRMFIDDDELTMFVEGFIAGRTSVTREQIAEVLGAHRLIEGSDFAGRLNGDWWCACRWRESRSGHLAHQAEAVRALFREERRGRATSV